VFLTDHFSANQLNPEVENRPLLEILHSLHSRFPVLDRLGSSLPCTLHHQFYMSHQISGFAQILVMNSNFARCETVQPPLLLKHRISKKACESDANLRSDALWALPLLDLNFPLVVSPSCSPSHLLQSTTPVVKTSLFCQRKFVSTAARTRKSLTNNSTNNVFSGSTPCLILRDCKCCPAFSLK
jgi:hypothetical protein